jgi:hypothetical protein
MAFSSGLNRRCLFGGGAIAVVSSDCMAMVLEKLKDGVNKK